MSKKNKMNLFKKISAKISKKIPFLEICLVFFLFLIMALTFYLLDCKKNSTNFVTYSKTFSEGRVKTEDSKYTISNKNDSLILEIEKQPIYKKNNYFVKDEFCCTGRIINKSIHDFTDWTITIGVQPNYKVSYFKDAEYSFYYTLNQPAFSSTTASKLSRQYKTERDLIVIKKADKDNDIKGIVTSKIAASKLGKSKFFEKKIGLKQTNNQSGYDFAFNLFSNKEHEANITNISLRGRFVYWPFEDPLFYILIFSIILEIFIITFFALVKINSKKM